MTENVPIICTDILPVKNGAVGVIRRATGSQAGKLTILGGRIYHSETITDAITRHLKTDLNIDTFTYHDNLLEEKPFMVQQYFMQDSVGGNEQYGFDPTKHALALTYLVEIDDVNILPRNEASDIVWITEKITKPLTTGFNQHVVVNKALDYLRLLDT